MDLTPKPLCSVSDLKNPIFISQKIKLIPVNVKTASFLKVAAACGFFIFYESWTARVLNMIHRQKQLFWRTVKNPAKIGVNLSFFIFTVHVVSFTFTVDFTYFFVMVSFYPPGPRLCLSRREN